MLPPACQHVVQRAEQCGIPLVQRQEGKPLRDLGIVDADLGQQGMVGLHVQICFTLMLSVWMR
jgi:hypothetical protein